MTPLQLILDLRTLAFLLKQGFPLVEALDRVALRSRGEAGWKACAEQVRRGSTFPKALTSVGGFPEEMAVAVSSERDSNLPEVLEELSSLLRGQTREHHQWQATLIYPFFLGLGLVILLILAALFFNYYSGLLDTVTNIGPPPSLANLLKEASPQLQQPGKIAASSLLILRLRTFFNVAAVISCLLPFLIYMVLSRPANRLRVPLVGTNLLDQAALSFMRWLDWSLRQGHPLPAAMRQSAAACSVPLLRDQLLMAARELETGSSFPAALERVTLFPSLAGWLLKRAEAAQFSGDSLPRAREAYSTRVDNRLRYMLAFAQPMLVLLFAIITFSLVLLILTPLFPTSDLWLNI